MRIINRIGLVMVCLLLSINSGAFAVEPFTVEDAVAEALDQNKELKLYDDKLKLLDRRIRTAEADADRYENNLGDSESERVENATRVFLTPLQKGNQKDQLLRDRADFLDSLRLGIEEAYINVYLASQRLGDAKSDLSYYEEQLDLKRKELEVGTVTETDVAQYQLKVDEAKISIASAGNTLENRLMTLNNLMGVKLDTYWNISAVETSAKKLEIKDFDPLIDTATSGKDTILTLEEQLEEKEVERSISISYENTRDEEKVQDFDEALLDLRRQIEDEEVSIEAKLRMDYNDSLNEYDNLKIAQLDESYQQKLTEISKLKHELGLISDIEYKGQQESLRAAKRKVEDIQANYYIAYKKYINYLYQTHNQ